MTTRSIEAFPFWASFWMRKLSGRQTESTLIEKLAIAWMHSERRSNLE